MTKIWRWTALLLSAALWALAATPAAGSAEGTWSPHALYVPPVAPMRVLALARLPAQPWEAGHRGLDFEAARGHEVVASAPGVVSFADVVVDRPVLTIRHDDGALSTVEPVVSHLDVGTRVSPGQVVGTVSEVPGHCAPNTCVHWGVRVAGKYIDPLDVLAGFGPVVLLPRNAGAGVASRGARGCGRRGALAWR